MRSIFGQGERSQVPHLKLVSRGNQDAGTITCSYCHMAIVTNNKNVWLYPLFFISMTTPWGHTLRSIMDKHHKTFMCRCKTIIYIRVKNVEVVRSTYQVF